MLLYVFCYDDASEKEVNSILSRSSEFPNLILSKLWLKPDIFYENQFFSHKFSHLPTHDDWNSHEFVGIISYKYFKKTQSTFNCLNAALANNRDADVIALYDFDNDLIKHAESVHGHLFVEIWCKLMEPIFGKSNCTRRDLPAFYCNFWFARPRWLKKYISFAQKIMHTIDTDPEINSQIFENPGYAGKMPKAELIAISGKHHYTFHPFVMERLPCIFFYLSGAKIGRRQKPDKSWKIWEPFSEQKVNDLLRPLQGRGELGGIADLKSIPSTGRVAIFATHSKQSKLDSNKIIYINEISQNFDLVIVITTQKNVFQHANLASNCRFVETDNSCHDFGLFFRVLYNLDFVQCNVSEIALINDSCWILKSIQEVITRARTKSEDVIALTDSNEVSYHLQSFFLIFRGASLPVLKDFVKQSKMYPIEMMNKWHVIKNFEIGLSVILKRRNISLGAIYPVLEVSKISSQLQSNGTNTSYTCWDKLLLMGCPVLKRARKTYEGEYNFIREYTEL